MNTNAIVPVVPNAVARPIEMDTTQMSTAYCNFFRVAGTYEELIIDFGFLSGVVIAQTAGQTTEPVKMSDRVIMSFATAKRLYLGLQAALAQHEQPVRPEMKEEK